MTSYELRLIDHLNARNISFELYRKPSYTGVSIHTSSLQPEKQKMAITKSAIHRLVNLTLGETAIEEESKVIKRIAQINGLKLNIVRMIREKRLRALIAENIWTQGRTSKGKEKCIKLSFLGSSSSKFASELRRHGYRAAFYPVNTVGKLSQLKDPTPSSKISGLYRVKYGNCDSAYISQTDRSFYQGILEHVNQFYHDQRNRAGPRNAHRAPIDSSVAQHFLSFDHDISNMTF